MNKIFNAEKELFKKNNLLQKYNKHYYDRNKPIVSDQIFDLLKKDVIKFRK